MKKKWFWYAVPVIILAAVCLVAAGVLYAVLNGRALDTRPLVRIQNPANQDQVEVGKGLIVHATASQQQGVRRIELWAGDRLIAEREAPSGAVAAQMVISAGWVPYQPGSHRLVARAFTKDGVEGQSSVEVQAVEAALPGLTAHVVQEGETLEAIAASYGVEEQQIAELNGASAPVEPQPGADLIVPAPAGGGFDEAAPEPGAGPDEEGGDEPGCGEDEGLPPCPNPPPPGRFLLFPGLFEMIPFQPPAEPAQLTAEVLALETGAPFDAVHCYASLAGSDPRWVPDVDSNQDTDESFASTAAGRAWDVAGHLSGDRALRFSWPQDQPVPLDISCVGVNGGIDSVKLGRIRDSAGPDEWGVVQRVSSSGGEVGFRLAYRVSWPEKGLDPTMTPPWNARLDAAQHMLLWDYLPDDDPENDIDGFAILLNDTLQWTEHRAARETRLPEQWFNLPCGDEYRFQVVAFRQGYPDGDYSSPSNTASIAGGEVGGPGCGRSVVVTFEHLSTGDLGGRRSPVYGSFFANEQQIAFDGRPVSGDNFPTSFGLDSNSQYTVGDISSGFGSGESQLVVELPPGRAGVLEHPLWIGFDIYKDGGKVCAGETALSEDRLAGRYSGVVETDSPAGSLPDKCRVGYTVEPVGGAPVVEPGSPPPLPSLVVEDLSADPSTGRLRIHVRNIGQAAWTGQDLVARAFWPDGEEIGEVSFANMTLEPGERNILSHGALNPQPALGACVLLDPENAVQEERDRYVEENILPPPAPYCRPLPDLSISKVEYIAEIGQLNVTVQNRGERTASVSDTDGSLENASLLVWIELPDGRPLTTHYDGISLGARDEIILGWPIGETERERMRGGYRVVLNPDNSIPELDTGNNAYEVGETARLRLVWKAGWATFCPSGNVLVYGENIGGKNTWDMQLSAAVGSGTSRRVVANWNSPEMEMTWREESGVGWCRNNPPFISDWFEVAGDEELTVSLTAGLDIVGHGWRWFSGGAESLTAADDFGGTTHVSPDFDPDCYLSAHNYTYDAGPSIGLGACGTLPCPGLVQTGMRRTGIITASGDEITGWCWWATTYEIYRED